MSRYPEADEAQHGHYNDGYSPYPQHSITPNPYDQAAVRCWHRHTALRPFQPIPQHNPYSSPPPPPPPPSNIYPPPAQQLPLDSGYNPYRPPTAPIHPLSPPPLQVHSPPPPPNHMQLGPISQVSLTPSPGPSTQSMYGRGYDLHDDAEMDTGDMPLLRRDPSSMSSMPRIPGDFEDEPEGTMDDGRSENNIRYGRIPQRVPRRYKTIKKVELFHGNFVLDNAVPKKLLDMCANRTDREFTHMRYSAATCDPNDFKDSGFTLRQVHYDPPRRTELFIVMTMYNEDEELFCRTMHGVEGWKKVVVCIVSDGRAKINSRTLSVLAAMGCYQEGVAKTKIGKQDVTAHIYEYTAQISITPSLKIEGAEKGVVPVQIIFCLKEKNQKKINSHRWFFNAFGPILQPNVCVLLDVGTMPPYEYIPSVEGGKYGQNLINPLIAAQNFEYKMSNILDKPLESVFGYITVLPGAFSAYRYIALQNDSTGEGPLQKYFLGESMVVSLFCWLGWVGLHGAGADIFTANMYLAEDRILCWELVSKRGGSWILHYVKSAYAVTDVPDQVPELISQRRRWLNGSFFAAIHSTVHFHYIYRSSHTFIRKAWIHVEMVYQLFNLIFSWFALANYYIAFSILSESMEDPSFHLTGIHIVNIVLNYCYLGLLIMCFILSLGNRPQGSKWGYTTAMIGFSLITIYMTVAAFLLAFKGIENLAHSNGPLTFSDIFTNPIFRNIVVSLLATLGLYLIASIIFFEPWHMITSFIQYLLMAPSYINVLNVYAFANVHDVSWGTKGDNTVAKALGTVTTGKSGEVEAEVPTDEKDINALYEDAIHVLNTKPPKVESKPDTGTQQEDYYRSFRTNVLLTWVLTNALLGATITITNAKAASSDGGANKAVNGYMAFLLASVAGLALIRFIGSTTYMLVRLFAGE
ncbi:chitin synthase-domain-containing protein [Gymnopilus junonius]|uniref:Chitin synthase n=1 Tax=Gymnopilus junonius TaxID=109634 RepID=A0A9P5NL80_GYMJU|nr:chitin synthase-domain-containing protein [Gymnopilus junonius]